jgi:hypothetical protein
MHFHTFALILTEFGMMIDDLSEEVYDPSNPK